MLNTTTVFSFPGRSRKILFLLFLALIFNWFFWKEKSGINLFIYTALIQVYFLFLSRYRVFTKQEYISFAITVITGFLIFILNTDLVKVIHIISLFITAGFIHQEKLKSAPFSLAAASANYAALPGKLRDSFKEITQRYSYLDKSAYYLKLSVLPLFVMVVFLLIYHEANPVFAHYYKIFFNRLRLLIQFSPERFLFMLFGFIVTAGVIIDAGFNAIARKEAAQADNLERKRNKYYANTPSLTRALQRENATAVIMVSLINLLLLGVNVADIKTLWLGFEVPVAFNLKQFVHTGTWLLIASIFLSMAIMLYYFRGNLNFHRKNSTLKTASYIWIFQNIILAASVFLRNYHYIAYHGLAYKRIGVIVFLILTIIGLLTLLIKIRSRKTFYYLVKVNGWSLYVALFILCFFNWDNIIVRYNLAHPNKKDIDVDFYLTLSDKALPHLYASLPVIREQIEAHKTNQYWYIKTLSIEDFKRKLDNKRIAFIEKQKAYTWLSYNLADANTKKALSAN